MLDQELEHIAKTDLDGVNLRHKIISSDLVSSVRAINKDIWCWTVNELEDALRMEDLGVSAITTDRPKWLKDKVADL